MAFKSDIDPIWEKYGIYDILTVYETDKEHKFPDKFPFYIDDKMDGLVMGWFAHGDGYDDMMEAKRRWEEHTKLVTLLHEVRTFLTPPLSIVDESNPYVKELVEKIDKIS
jgi:hypothetical protein